MSGFNCIKREIADNEITESKIAPDAVTGDKIADDAVGPDQLNNSGSYEVAGLETGDLRYTDTFWDDLVIPAELINLAGPANAPAYDATDMTVDFSASAINTVQFNYQLSHRWKEGTNVVFHIHALPSNTDTGNVLWEWKYRWTSIYGVAGAWNTTTALEAMPGVEDKHIIMAEKNISGEGHMISSILQIQLQRLGNDGTDTFTGLVQMLSADVHFEIDRPGSRQEYVK